MKRLFATLALAGMTLVGLFGGLASAQLDPTKTLGHLTQPSPGCPTGCYNGPAVATPVQSAPVDHIQDVGDCVQAAAYIHQHGAPGFAVDCPYPLPAHYAAETWPGVIYISNVNCAAAYENEASNSHGTYNSETGQWTWPSVGFDPFGPCYAG